MQLFSPYDVIQFLEKNHGELKDAGINLGIKTVRTSPNAVYYTVGQFYNGIEVLGTQLKICVDKSGHTRFITGNLFATQSWSLPTTGQNSITIPDKVRSQFGLSSTAAEQVISVDENGEPTIIYRADENFENDRSRVTLFLSGDGELIHVNDHKIYFSADTTVYGYAFKPDPLTSAGVTYGGEYDDNNDEDNDALHAELFEVEMQATFEDGYFFLKTDSLKLKDLGAPGDGIVTLTDDQFYFPRNDNSFEDVNTFFHIQNFINYLTGIGYEPLANFYIEIDPHGAGGADQSYFVGGAVPSIQYGEGGVDDAEDADVLIHEFAHGLSNQAAPGTNDGNERRAAEEGYGDYFAVSYSRMFSDFNWDNVFSWDGHNEFWSGRNANTNKHYPEDVNADFYKTSEIWSGALMDIFDVIGKENCDQLVCEALYGSFSDMSLHEAALLILEAEDIVFSGAYYDVVYDLLDARGLLDPVAIENPSSQSGILFLNTEGFCMAGEEMEIVLPLDESFHIAIYTVEGKLIFQSNGTGNSIVVNPDVVAGHNVLIISVATPTLSESIQLVKVK